MVEGHTFLRAVMIMPSETAEETLSVINLSALCLPNVSCIAEVYSTLLEHCHATVDSFIRNSDLFLGYSFAVYAVIIS